MADFFEDHAQGAVAALVLVLAILSRSRASSIS
jgi:hypothetical protein